MSTLVQVLKRPEEGIGSPEAGVTSNCRPTDQGVRNQAQQEQYALLKILRPLSAHTH